MPSPRRVQLGVVAGQRARRQQSRVRRRRDEDAIVVFDEWCQASGVSHFNDESLSPHYAHVGNVMSVTQQSPERKRAAMRSP